MNLPYYFVCVRCDAKWFARLPRVMCPRCEQWCSSREQRRPPWWKSSPGQAKSACDHGASHQAAEDWTKNGRRERMDG
jgi:hypothetical protein